jgi:predicted extracellular nuclease
MKKYISLGILSLLCGCQLSTEKESEMINEGELLSANNQVVAFYNVENLFDLENDRQTNDDDFTPYGVQHWTKERYDRKLENLSTVLCDLGNQAPMLIGLVEVENQKVVEALAEKGGLANTSYKLVQYDSPDRRGIDCALLYDSRRMIVEEQEKLNVSLPGNSSYLTRDILHVTGKIAGNETIHVFVNHWSSRREGTSETEHKRLQSATVLKEKIAEIRGEEGDVKIIVMGDFNDEPKNKSIQEILNASGPKASLFNLMIQPAQDGEGTIVYHREWLMFDQLMVSQNLLSGQGVKVKNDKAYVYSDESILFTYKNGGQKPNSTYGGPNYYGGYSDHLPVYLILEQ